MNDSFFGSGGAGSYRSGASLCSPNHPAMEISLVGSHIIYLEDEKWYQHYNECLMMPVSKSESRYTLPRPLMFYNIPIWGGGLSPNGIAPKNNNHQIVCNFNLQYVLCPVEKIRVPKDKEYDLHFRQHIQNRNFVLMESIKDRKKIIKVVNRESTA